MTNHFLYPKIRVTTWIFEIFLHGNTINKLQEVYDDK